MTMVRLIEYAEANTEVRAVYDDIMKTRRTDWINNFWKVLANDPATLRRTWAAAKKAGMTAEMLAELMAIVGMANETNSLANGYRVPVDERFENLF